MGSDRGSDIVSSLGPVAVAPLPPAYIATTKALPFSIKGDSTFLTVRDFVPSLPEGFNIRVIINGVDSGIKDFNSAYVINVYNQDGTTLDLDYNEAYGTITLQGNSVADVIVSTYEMYINGDKVTFIHE